MKECARSFRGRIEAGLQARLGSGPPGLNTPCYHRVTSRLRPSRLRRGRLCHSMHIEFLGIPRERAGISELEIEAGTLGQLLGTLVTRCPGLGELITSDGLHPS